MGKRCLIYLDGGDVYSCKSCEAHLALTDEVDSKTFHCRNGKAYLMNKVVNVSHEKQEDRQMMTGMYTVVDTHCLGCGSNVGWKYVFAHESSQKCKEGKFILDRSKVLGPGGRLNSKVMTLSLEGVVDMYRDCIHFV